MSTYSPEALAEIESQIAELATSLASTQTTRDTLHASLAGLHAAIQAAQEAHLSAVMAHQSADWLARRKASDLTKLKMQSAKWTMPFDAYKAMENGPQSAQTWRTSP